MPLCDRNVEWPSWTWLLRKGRKNTQTIKLRGYNVKESSGI